jgi:hypothetical protein
MLEELRKLVEALEKRRDVVLSKSMIVDGL